MALVYEAIYLGNYAAIDPTEGNSSSENASSLLGTYGSVATPLYDERVTIDTDGVDGGAAGAWDTNNNVTNDTFSVDYNDGSGFQAVTYDAITVYNATITYMDGTTASITAVVVQTTSGETYLFPEYSANADSAAMEDQAIVSISLDSVANSTNVNTAIDRYATDFVCFARGSKIKTSTGMIAVEGLEIGDMVKTRDNGFQPIRWIGSQEVSATGRNAPILIEKGALNEMGIQKNKHPIPVNDLYVSPQHRILITNSNCELLFGQKHVLIPAKHLCNGNSISVNQRPAVEYFHILFDEHEVIVAEGLETESFHPQKQGMDALSEQVRNEIFDIFPNLKSGYDTYGPTSYMCLKKREIQMIFAT